MICAGIPLDMRNNLVLQNRTFQPDLLPARNSILIIRVANRVDFASTRRTKVQILVLIIII